MFFLFIREGRCSTVPGYYLFIAIMAADYFYNVTFIQLGFTD
ncbi:MAG TPA: hypothetical protein PLV53_02330 [Anaerolineaceae bacterium]|nr:hypothetical protein [Anaerolineaceae bacterium]